MTLSRRIVLLFTIFLFGLMVMEQRSETSTEPKYCHKRPTNLTSLLSSMEPYRYVGNTEDSAWVSDGCVAIQLWGLFRHGTRNPNPTQINEVKEMLLPLKDTIVENFESGKGSLCASDIALLKNWKMHLTEENAFTLAEEGARELRNIGSRFKRRFPNLFSKPYNETFYEFHHTTAIRTAESASNFSAGVFGEENVSKIKYEDPLQSARYLRFYKLCEKYLQEVKYSVLSRIEKAEFENRSEYKQMIKNVSRRLGFVESLPSDVVLLMYSFCAFDTAWNDAPLAAWCSAFSEEDMEVIQYRRDLNHFAIHGYRTEITYKQACPLVKNIFDFLNSGVDTPAVKLNFAHADTLLKLLTSLGLYKDPHLLKASDYSSNRNRKWKDSVIVPFAGNIVFVLFDCRGEKKVLALHNEREITLPGCPETSLCPLKTILKTYQDRIENCNFKEMCAVEPITQ